MVACNVQPYLSVLPKFCTDLPQPRARRWAHAQHIHTGKREEDLHFVE